MHPPCFSLKQGGPEVAQYCADHVAEVLLDTQGAYMYIRAVCVRACVCLLCGAFVPDRVAWVGMEWASPRMPASSYTRAYHTLTASGFKEGNWEGALTQSFLTLDRRLAGEEGQRELGERVRAEKERSKSLARLVLLSVF